MFRCTIHRQKKIFRHYFLQKLNNENAKLQELLDGKSLEVHNLNERIVKLTNSINQLTHECSAASNAKVTELTKKNRRLTSELNAMNFKNRSLEDNQQELVKLLDEKDAQLKDKTSSSVVEPASPSEVQTLADKLAKANKKISETLNQNLNLKNELRAAQKCLQQEIGEPVNVAQLLSGSSNWLGRAQQIKLLQSKISELKGKFDTTSFDSGDDISRFPLKRLEIVRRTEVESLSKELDECKSTLEEVKQKVVALKARNNNLADQANDYKLKTLDLLEKSTRDEDLIKCLNEQISMTKYEFNHKIEELKKEKNSWNQEKQGIELEIQKLQCHIQYQEGLLNEKENEKTYLKEANDELETNLRNFSGDFLFSCRQMSKDDFTAMLENLEEEKRNLLRLMHELNVRLDKESVKCSEQHNVIQKLRLKISRLEANLNEAVAEIDASKKKNRRSLRISDYSRRQSFESIASASSGNQITAEVDKHKFK